MCLLDAFHAFLRLGRRAHTAVPTPLPSFRTRKQMFSFLFSNYNDAQWIEKRDRKRKGKASDRRAEKAKPIRLQDRADEDYSLPYMSFVKWVIC